MNRDTLLADLRARGLSGFCFFEDPRGKAHVVVISFGRDGFQTWLQDERAQPIVSSLRTFAEERDALSDLAHRVEVWNRIDGVRSPVAQA
ncbi:hypothetical protein [Microbacterium sp. H83]|jgi:hypothetical protein|uniref:hypothetical protein n=1 Tax=Microbacterium sp. H83 TaxID=1827324 RepID=UPI0007F484AF|nr:hypothetical protein [Microbacterium sp. H83]OAN42095.1 hypothetical protein A4X16_10190 [Microbacterium sp. H83]